MKLPPNKQHEDTSSVPFLMAHIFGEKDKFFLTMDLLKVHMAVLGGSGSGKSKFLELLIRYLLVLGEGGIFFDPHGDTADLAMAFVYHQLRKGNKDLFDRVHFLEVSPQRSFSFDPFANLPGRNDVSRIEYGALLEAKVDRITANILRRVPEAQQMIMNRMSRWMQNFTFACGVDYIGNNTHLGFDKALIFTNPQHPLFDPLLDKVFPYLPEHVQQDFITLRNTKRVRDQEAWVESSINQLRKVLRQFTKILVGQHAPSIDLYRIMRERGFMIVSMPESDYLSHAQKIAILGLLINEVLTVKQAEERKFPPDQRVRHTMILDECGELLGEDLKLALGATRKYKLPMVLAAQNLRKFCLGDFEMGAEVMDECQVKVIFQQQDDENLQKVVRSIGHGNIDTTERVVEVQRQRGWTEEDIEEHSYGRNLGVNSSQGGSESDGENESLQKSQQIANSEGRSSTTGSAKAIQHVETAGDTKGRSKAEGESELRGALVPHKTESENKTENESSHRSAADGQTNTENQSETTNYGMTKTDGETRGAGRSHEVGANWANGQNQGWSHTVAYKKQVLANIVSEYEPSGQLEQGPIEVQWARMFQQVHGLETAEFVTKHPGRKDAYLCKTVWIEPEWHGAALWEAAELCKKMVTARHRYNFVPNDLPDEAAEPIEMDEPIIVHGNGQANGKQHRNGHKKNSEKNPMT